MPEQDQHKQERLAGPLPSPHHTVGWTDRCSKMLPGQREVDDNGLVTWLCTYYAAHTTCYLWSHPVEDGVGCFIIEAAHRLFPCRPSFTNTHTHTHTYIPPAAAAAAALCFVPPDDFPVKRFAGAKALVLAIGDRTAVLLISG